MTPDRPDHTHDDAEHGVLSDTGNLDTTGLGIIAAGTEQVSVELPSNDDEDDDFVEDDIPVSSDFDALIAGRSITIEVAAEDMPAREPESFETGEVTTAEIVEVDGDGTAETESDEDATAKDAVTGGVSSTVDAEPYTGVDLDGDLESDAEAGAEAESEAGTEAGDNADVATEADSLTAADAAPEGDVVDEPLSLHVLPSVESEDSAHAEQNQAFVSTPEGEESDMSDPAASQPASAPAAASAAPLTRRATGEVALTSKRLGEFEADRETADLLTADRLLDPNHVVKSEPEGAWQHFVYSISGRRINLGDSKRARARKELDRRIAAPLAGGARFVPVLSRKGGVGKTTVTTLLGMALADARDDRVIAVDANPDRGTLAERISRTGGKTVRDLVRVRGDVVGFNDLSGMVARDETRLDVVASDADPRVSEAFSDADYRDVASLAAHYYSIVLTDTGTGIVHSVMEATLDAADQLVIVAGLSVDEARLASETLTWLETNGYAAAVRNAVVVINSARPGSPVVRLEELEAHFKTRVRAVQRMPYDPHIAAGSAISFRDLQAETRLAARELAATVVEGLRSLATAA
ncbi:MinD/ParA family protein [Microbacterium sp. C7(2022)]|uniref:MinD/ParA family ATP-binding protein n=1 Tax=Microbacterium sp. C7(2022) TaxID=2992759 RepID=UPI00237BFE44|nr:MinD/ParA family protein [Microbacterium sp. C7(2022)]MDE0546733.1 MinD/ParA family protein [Microbacterium sp. C7(2022)]